MLLVRLLLALVLAVGLLPTHGDAMAASQPMHAVAQHHAMAMTAAEHCGSPCQAPANKQMPQDHCQAVMGACCVAPAPETAGTLIPPAPVAIAWRPMLASLPGGLGYRPATPPPRI